LACGPALGRGLLASVDNVGKRGDTGKMPVDRTTMQSYISQEATKSPQPEVHIAVDKFSKYEFVAQPWRICSTGT
jgi:biopolymer transport protein ExbD